MKFKKILILFTIIISPILFSKDYKTVNGNVNEYSYEFLKKEIKNSYYFEKNKNYYEVFYFHDYKCPSCYMLQPKINLWREAFKRQNTRYIPIPISLNSEYGSSYLYLILRELDYKTEYIKSIQNEIFEKKIEINTKSKVFNYLNKKIDLSKLEFNKIVSSLKFNSKLKTINNIQKTYSIKETPLLIINYKNNRYKIKTENNSPLSIILSLNLITNQK